MKRNSRGEYLPPEPPWTAFTEYPNPADPGGRLYRNSRYQVIYREYPGSTEGACLGCQGGKGYQGTEGWEPCRLCGGRGRADNPPLRHLSIKRVDGRPVRKWRDLQRLKNEFLGPEEAAWEAFPRESELVDTANQFHLLSIRGVNLPSPMQRRLVANCPLPGGTQDAWEPGTEPPDLETDQRRVLEHLACTSGEV